MDAVGVRTMVFSSSAAVYAPKAGQLITEDDPVAASNPYGRTKIMIEQILQVRVAVLRSWRELFLYH